MYDYERLHEDQRRARAADPAGHRTNNALELEAKLNQLRELIDKVEDEPTGFILREILEMLP